MALYRYVLAKIVFSLQVFLLLLLIFYQQLRVPEWLLTAGHFHPLLLHIPITLILLLIIFLLFRKHWKHLQGFDDLYSLLLLHTVFFASITAISGIFLSTESGYNPDILNWHKWFGGAIAMMSYLAWLILNRFNPSFPIFKILMFLSGIILVIGSHNGGILTHGEDYLNVRPEKDPEVLKKMATDSSSIYEAAIQPLLKARCYSCHNEKKAKGNLVMSRMEQFLKGGKEGPPWMPGDPENSLLIKRLLLDMGDKKHMPPKDKTQLTDAEISLLHQWIGKGANFKQTFQDYSPTDSFRIFASSYVIPLGQYVIGQEKYDFEAANPELVSKLNNPYRSITPKNKRSPALILSFYVSQQFRLEMLEECIPLKNQIVTVNLSHMPVQDDALKTIAQFINLEELSLNGTKISGSNLQLLESCKKLEKISLANSKISMSNSEKLGKIGSLKKVYLWQSGLSSKEIDELAKRFPQINWDRGSISDSTEILKLTSPLMKNPEKTIFNPSEEFSIKHPLKGVKILFTLDGTDPDSIHSPVYQQPIPIVAPTIVKARATMNGWFTSDISEWALYAKGIKPAYAHLLNNPDPKYSIYGGESLIDGNKGESNNLMVNWLGFRNNSMKVKFSFLQDDSITKVVLSMADNIGSYIFPPELIIVKGGNDSNQLKPIGMFTPVQPAKYGPSRNKSYTVQLRKGRYRYILIEARPVASLPKWHSGKKERGWIFVDEIFFY